MGSPQSMSIEELKERSRLPANKAGGALVASFFEANKQSIADALPRTMNPDRLMKVALGAIRTTPALLQCSTKSLFGAVVQCAQLGLEPNTVLGHAYLVPFNKKNKDGSWGKDVQVIIGYKGLVDLARRSGQVASIAAHPVFKNDHFELELGLQDKLVHKPFLDGDRGEVVGFYAVAKLKESEPAFEFMSARDVRAVMLQSQSKGEKGPWKDNFIEMGRKTVIRRLSKFLPLSVEFSTAVAIDAKAAKDESQGMDAVLEGSFSVSDEDAPQGVDFETGEIQGQDAPAATEPKAEPPKQAQPKAKAMPATPKFSAQDALDMAASGDYDQARDIARSIGKGAIDAVEREIDALENDGKTTNIFGDAE